MLLRQIATWLPLAQSYWTTQINSSGYTNISELLSIMNNFLTDLQTSYDGYVIKTKNNKDSMADFLLPLYGYITMKFGMTLPVQAPPIPSLISGEDIRTLFENWSDVLIETNSYYSSLFTLQATPASPPPEPPPEPPEPPPEPDGSGQIITTTEYNNLLAFINDGVTSDTANLENFRLTLGYGLMNRSVYMTNAHPRVTPVLGFDARNQQLFIMNLLEIFKEFNWIFAGLYDGDWLLSITYGQGQALYLDNHVYGCLLDHTSSNKNKPGIDLYSNWASGIAYTTDNIIYASNNLVYRCLRNHTSSTQTEPNIELYDNWIVNKSYKVDRTLYNGDHIYTCILKHRSTLATEPGVGVNWETYWSLIGDKWTYDWIFVENGWRIYWYLIG